MRILLTGGFFLMLFVMGCNSSGGSADSASLETNTGQSEGPEQRTPVHVTGGIIATIKDTVLFNAVSAYLQSEEIKSDMNGYIKAIRTAPGDKALRGQTLFIIQTKEARSLGNLINRLDSTYQFSGVSRIKAPVNGFVTELNHQVGDFVQQGEVLARMSDAGSFGFTLHLPFESHALLSRGQSVNIDLPDGTVVSGYVDKILSQLDSVSQTQQVFIKVRSTGRNIPSALMASVVLTRSSFTGFCLPRACVYTDELKQNFWVLQVMNDSMIHKVPVKVGYESDSLTAITAPLFSLTDLFVDQGGYGLEDSAAIKITDHE